MVKERYLTDGNLNSKTTEWMNDPEIHLRRHANFTFDPRNSALLVMDMQRFFLRKKSHAFVPSAPPLVPGLSALIRVFSDNGRPVFFTRHVSTSSPRTMLEWWRDPLRDGDEMSELIGGLDASRGAVLKKSTYDAFLGTDLEEHLDASNVGQVVICGVMTHLCCDTTARSAFNRGFQVFFPVDGTATYNASFHRATLINLAHGFAVPTTVDKLRRAFPDD